MSEFPKTPRNRVKRLPKRAEYDRDVVYAVVDSAPICHVGFVQDGQPFVLPTIHARLDDTLIIHGSTASRMMKALGGGSELCVTVTHLDGLVLARSAFHHSMNYRSAVLFGRGEIIKDQAEKLAALEAVSELLVPGRWAEIRRPTEQELKATTVVRMLIESASVKSRAGDPIDDEADYSLPIWAGVLPISATPGALRADARLDPAVPIPMHLAVFEH
ncbi:MAG: pyridoxamine 5'-phosphate oxidase family protein [Dehalococcoidia bacterium]